MRWLCTTQSIMVNNWISGYQGETKTCGGRRIRWVLICFPLIVAVSFVLIQCNGFSAGVNPDDFRGPGFKSGYDPVWMDLLAKHSQKPFHCMVGGGDQLYCDPCVIVQKARPQQSTDLFVSLMREFEMQDWVSKNPEEKKVYPLSGEMETAIDRFFFNHYCQSFRSGAFARANCSM